MPIITRALVYFSVSATLGLLSGFALIKILPRPKNKVLRREMNSIIAKCVTALFLLGGIYLFVQTI